VINFRNTRKETHRRRWSLLVVAIWHRVFVVTLGRVIRLPTACGENVLVAFVPATQQNLARVRVFFLDGSVIYEAHIIVHIEGEQRTALSARLTKKYTFAINFDTLVQTTSTFYTCVPPLSHGSYLFYQKKKTGQCERCSSTFESTWHALV